MNRTGTMKKGQWDWSKGEELLQIAANIEGHPDNVAPALYGGIQLGIHTRSPSNPTGGRWLSSRVRGILALVPCLIRLLRVLTRVTYTTTLSLYRIPHSR